MTSQMFEMTLAISTLFIMLILLTLVGISVFSIIPGKTSLRLWLLAPFIGLAIFSTVGFLSAFVGIDGIVPMFFVALILIVVALTFKRFEFISLARRSRKYVSENKKQIIFIVLLPISAGIFALATQFDSEIGFTYLARTGPDGLGYAISSQALSMGLSPAAISSQASDQLGNIPIGDIISSLTSGIYDLPSFTLQVQNEFLVGAQRLGFASIAGILIQLLGMGNLWLVQAVLAAVSFSLTVLLGIFVLSRNTFRWLKIILFTIFVVLSPVLLYSWFEGGTGQIFAMPAFLAFFVAIFYIKINVLKLLVTAGAVSILISSYLDGFFLALIFLAALYILQILKVTPEIRQKSTLFVGICLGLLITLPISITIPQSIAARANDSGQAGWQVPSNFGFLQLFGFKNFYSPASETSQLLWREFQTSQTAVVLLIPVGIIFGAIVVLHSLLRRKLSWEITTLLLGLFAISGQFILTQLMGSNNNYQLLKMAAMVLPLLLLMFSAIQAKTPAFITNRVSFAPLWNTTFKPLVSIATVGILLVSTISFFEETAEHTIPIDSELVQVAYTAETNQLFEKYMFVTTESSPKVVEDYFLGTLGDFYWLNRGPGVLKINSNQRSLALLGNGIETKTSDTESPFSIVSEPSQATTQKYVIDLHENPSIISSHTPDDACLIAGILYSAQHEIALTRCDPEKAVLSGGVFTNTGITADLGSNSLLTTDNAEIRFISTVSPQLEVTPLLRINGELGSGEISLTPEGKLIYRDIASDSSSLIGWASSNSSTFARLIWSPNKLTAIVNNHPVGIEVANLGHIISVSATVTELSHGTFAGTVLPVTH